MNPYESTAAESRPHDSPSSPHWRILFAFASAAIATAISVIVISRIPIVPRVEPNVAAILQFGLIACIAFSLSGGLIGIYGTYSAVRDSWHPVLTSLLYLLVGVGLCYAGCTAVVVYVILWGR